MARAGHLPSSGNGQKGGMSLVVLHRPSCRAKWRKIWRESRPDISSITSRTRMGPLTAAKCF